MSPDNILLGLVVAYFAWRVFGALRARHRVPALLKEGAQIVDVRSLAEFARGHHPDSVNIPLDELDARGQELDRRCWVMAQPALKGLRPLFRRRNYLRPRPRRLCRQRAAHASTA